jgi:hypothetical protein
MKWNLAIEAEQLWLRVLEKYSFAAVRHSTRSFAFIAITTISLNLYRTAQRLHESSPNEIGVAADYARLGLLIDQTPAEAQRLAKETYERAPTEVNAAMTYAFSLYGLGRTAEGVEIMKKLPFEGLHDPACRCLCGCPPPG